MNKRVGYFTNLRVFSCFAIVALHAMSFAVSSFEPTKGQQIATMMVRNSLLWTVPCFVMVTGALLLDPKRELSLSYILGKYLLRIVLALLIFSFVFEIYDTIVQGAGLGAGIVPAALKDMVTGSGWSHLWYLYLIIALYFLLPFYRMITKQATDKEMVYLLIVYFVFQSMLPMITTVSGSRIAFYICIYSVYPLFLFLGYYLHNWEKKPSAWLAILLLLIGNGLLLLVTFFGISNNSETMRSLSGNYSFPAVVFSAAGIFLLFRCFEKKDAKSGPALDVAGEGIRERRWVKAIDACSFGIYLLHPLFLRLIYRLLPCDLYQIGGVFMALAVAIVAFLLSWAIIYVLKRIPGIQRVV